MNGHLPLLRVAMLVTAVPGETWILAEEKMQNGGNASRGVRLDSKRFAWGQTRDSGLLCQGAIEFLD